jgi:hypothetical protein
MIGMRKASTPVSLRTSVGTQALERASMLTSTACPGGHEKERDAEIPPGKSNNRN